jgi:hypothetical protein
LLSPPGRKPGGELLRKKRLQKKRQKWVLLEKARIDASAREASRAVQDLFETLLDFDALIRDDGAFHERA